ncbi:MAG: hypothetical protein ABIQ59_12290 [Nocardioidaceae bacterium]
MTPTLRRRLPVLSAVVVTLALLMTFALVTDDTPAIGRAEGPPPAAGYFKTLPPGAWAGLPDDQQCTDRVRRSDWEPRPDNQNANLQIPSEEQVKESWARRPRAVQGAFDPRWDSWLLPRVTGHHAGTTDENIQWAACKWGLSDNLVRAIAVRESDWYQYEVYSDGTCVLEHGCGDLVTRATPATRRYCSGLARSGVDYQRDLGAGRCPKTFSIVGVMSWHDPAWGGMVDNQNGTFPFNRDSTAFALDYLGAFLRGCQEGWVSWLKNNGSAYKAGMIWDCVAVWYAGKWRTPAAEKYESLVRGALRDRPWLDPAWATREPACSEAGCPRGAT